MRGEDFVKSNYLLLNDLQNLAGGIMYNVNTANEKLDKERVQEQRVAIGEPVWVQCDGYRCLAYQNQQGEWLAFHNGTKLAKVVKVLHDAIGR